MIYSCILKKRQLEIKKRLYESIWFGIASQIYYNTFTIYSVAVLMKSYNESNQ